MEIRAEARYIRRSPRKVRLVADMVRGKMVGEALVLLKFVSQAAAEPVAKVIASAAANAVKNFNQKETDLVIKKIVVDEGPRYKRRDRSRRAMRFGIIQKKTCHLKVILEGKDNGTQS